ncbi:hypothetical protein SNEBB_011378 [Seison nebaliae]|nr:hypothetical protein SNEBB_011378 [Seison nebaliae]
MNDRTRGRILLKVGFLGNSGVGKTAIINQFVFGRFLGNWPPTVNVDCCEVTKIINGFEVFLELWDTAGMERFSSLIRNYLRLMNWCILVCDLNDWYSVTQLQAWKDFFEDSCTNASYQFVVLANKHDNVVNRETVTANRTILQKWCRSNAIVLFETSAKENFNIDTAFTYLMKESCSDKRLCHKKQGKQTGRQCLFCRLGLQDESGGCCK